MNWTQFWQWAVNQGIIEGDPNYYINGTATEAEFGHAVREAYKNANDTQRRQLVDYLRTTGMFQGDQTYWYTYRGDEIDSLYNAGMGLVSYAYTDGGVDPAELPGAGSPNVTPQEPIGGDASGAPGVDVPDPTAPPSTGGGVTDEPEPDDTPTSDPTGEDTGSATTGLSREDLALIYYWLPPGALSVFIDAYIDKGADAAWAAVRQHSDYEVWFPGNKDDYGNIRYPEDQYAGVREGYRDVMRAAGIEPTAIAALEGRFVDLMEGEVSPQEFQARVESVYNRIVVASDQIKQYYADQYGIQGLSTQDLLFAAMDPEFGRLTLEENFRIAEVGGAAAESGFDIDAGLAELLSERGVNLPAARQVFGQAQSLVPIFDMLAQRHFDPDDDFDLQEFLSAEVFNDPAQNLRMRRLIAQERSNFAASSGFATSSGRITGLTAS